MKMASPLTIEKLKNYKEKGYNLEIYENKDNNKTEVYLTIPFNDDDYPYLLIEEDNTSNNKELMITGEGFLINMERLNWRRLTPEEWALELLGNIDPEKIVLEDTINNKDILLVEYLRKNKS